MHLVHVSALLLSLSTMVKGGAIPLLPAVVTQNDPHPQYQYAYSVQDALTGDSKSQHEIRDGGVVKGRYSLVEPDGVLRTVVYYADPIVGFNAVVRRDLPIVKPHPVVL